MPSSRSSLTVPFALTAALGVTLLAGAPAAAGGGGHTLLRAQLQGTFPLDDPVSPSPIIAGITPGGARWELDDNSRVRVREDGRITVVVRDLVVPGRTPGNPVREMVASLVCGDEIADSTVLFPVTPEGDGRVKDRISVPDDCDDPTVLIRNGVPGETDDPDGFGSYFAVATADDHD